MTWTFAQMAAARRIIRKNAKMFAPDLAVDGREITFEETETVLQTLLVAGVTYQDLVEQDTQWDSNRARYGRAR